MSVVISDVEVGSLAQKAGITIGDELVSVNNNPITDILDYRFYITEKKLSILCLRGGAEKVFRIRKSEYDDIGLSFDTYLMDKQRSCRNNCIFCFIDQLPAGMRESLYFKDDDSRLSFLFGNYITLTNLSDEDIDRIIKMRISPVNVSVHTMNPELRCKMMKNRFAGESLRHLSRLSQNGTQINCQLVLCPGINDGAELTRSLEELSKLTGVKSIAAVPVGLTKYRDGLTKLLEYDSASAAEVINIVDSFGKRMLAEKGDRFARCADEFYLKAGKDIPDYDYYGDFDQLENGVGIVRIFIDDFSRAIEDIGPEPANVRFSVATGTAACRFLQMAVDELRKKWHNLSCTVFGIENNFFGKSITVAGLVTAGDIISQLKDKDIGSTLIIPDVMLRHENDLFLDDISPDQLSESLCVPVIVSKTGGEGFFTAICEALSSGTNASSGRVAD